MALGASNGSCGACTTPTDVLSKKMEVVIMLNVLFVKVIYALKQEENQDQIIVQENVEVVLFPLALAHPQLGFHMGRFGPIWVHTRPGWKFLRAQGAPNYCSVVRIVKCL